MVTKKDRRHSGRKVIASYHPDKEPGEITIWDDWNDYRDSQRAGLYEDFSKIKPKVFNERLISWYFKRSTKTIRENNCKLKKKLNIRRSMKIMKELCDKKQD